MLDFDHLEHTIFGSRKRSLNGWFRDMVDPIGATTLKRNSVVHVHDPTE